MTIATKQPKKKFGIGMIILIAIAAILIIVVIANNMGGSKDTVTTTSVLPKNEHPTIGQVLKTKDFEVTVNKVEVVSELKTGSVLADIKLEDGSKFLMFNVTFKNIGKESRATVDGEVHINYQGKDHTIDRSETILADGYGLFMEPINPNTSRNTNLVYWLPKEIRGTAYFIPGRAGNDEKIMLGEIK